MAKLYAPTIKDASFYLIDGSDNYYISIPFYDNPSTPQLAIKNYKIIIKTVSTGQVIFTGSGGKVENGYLTFDNLVNDAGYSPKIGQVFKMQVAYVNYDNVEGNYSTAAIARYSISLKSLDIYRDFCVPNGFYVAASRGQDTNDPILSYTLVLNRVITWGGAGEPQSLEEAQERIDSVTSYNEESNSGIRYFNLQETGENDNYKDYYVFQDIALRAVNPYDYFLKAIINTTNGLVFEKRVSINVADKGETYNARQFQVENNFDYGYIRITFEPREGETVEEGSIGFLSKWDGNKYECLGVLQVNETYEDYNVEQGKSYSYSLGKYRYSTKAPYESYDIASLDLITVLADFEDMFLWDKEKVLRLRFNPEVSSYRTVKQESKVETLGGKYPFIFYNGLSGYKEFPISSFLSYEADEEEKFYSFQEDKTLYSRRNNTGVVGSDEYEGIMNYLKYQSYSSYYKERLFKNEVLNWLNNGRPKCFKSPYEGIFLVQTINSSLSPVNQLGRKNHTVNTTAVEIDDLTVENLEKYEIVSQPSYNMTQRATQNLQGIIKGGRSLNLEENTGRISHIKVGALVQDKELIIDPDADNSDLFSREPNDVNNYEKATDETYGVVQGNEIVNFTSGAVSSVNVEGLTADKELYLQPDANFEPLDESDQSIDITEREDAYQYYGVLGTPLATSIRGGLVIGNKNATIETPGEFATIRLSALHSPREGYTVAFDGGAE